MLAEFARVDLVPVFVNAIAIRLAREGNRQTLMGAG
jgi:hypothetical protein